MATYVSVCVSQDAYKAFKKGRFADAKQGFETILHAIPLMVVRTRKESQEVKELVGVCKEYLMALHLEMVRCLSCPARVVLMWFPQSLAAAGCRPKR